MSRAMKKITVFVVCVLFFANVMPIVAETPEVKEARIAGENDAKGVKWKWFAAGCMTINASAIAIALACWFNESCLVNTLDANPAGWSIIYGAYLLTPTAVALSNSPTPPADRLLGKSPEWVDAYTKAYQKGMRRYRAESSAAGCFIGGVVLGGTILSLAPDIWGATPD